MNILLAKYKLLNIQYKRDISSRIRHLATTFPVVAVTGARQVGKTTLLKQLLASISASSDTLWYYRDSQARELDFLHLNKGVMDLYEVKWSEIPDSRNFSHLAMMSEHLRKSKSYRLGKQSVICRTPHFTQPRILGQAL